jgi:hypothetical protein
MVDKKKNELSFSKYEKEQILDYLYDLKLFVSDNKEDAGVSINRIEKLIELYEAADDYIKLSNSDFHSTVCGAKGNVKKFGNRQSSNPSAAVAQGFKQTIAVYIDEYNEAHKLTKPYKIKLSGLVVSLEKNYMYQAVNEGSPSLNVTHMLKTNTGGEIKELVVEFLSAVKLSIMKPSELNDMNISNLKWYLHTMILFMLAFSVIVSVFMNNIPDIILMNMPEQWQSLQITLKGFDTYVYNFLGYILFMYLFALPYKKLGKSEFKTGQFAFANMLPTFILVIIGIPLYFAKITKAPNNFAIYDWIMLLATAVYIVAHIRTMKAVVGQKGFRLAYLYSVSVIFLAVSMSILKTTIY